MEFLKKLSLRCVETFVLGIVGAAAAGIVAVIGWSMAEIHILKSELIAQEKAKKVQLEVFTRKLQSDIQQLVKAVNENKEAIEAKRSPCPPEEPRSTMSDPEPVIEELQVREFPKKRNRIKIEPKYEQIFQQQQQIVEPIASPF